MFLLKNAMCVFCLFLAILEIRGQASLNVRRFGEFDGLSHHHCTSIAQDGDGMIWIGTWNGLDRFDGYDFVTFKSHAGDGSSLGYDRITDIHIIGSSILCKVEDECFLFNIKTGKFSDTKMTWNQTLRKYRFSEVPVKSIVDRHGIRWTVDSKGVKQEYQKLSYFTRIPQKTNSQVRCIYKDKKRRIWITNREDSTIRIFDEHLNLKGYLGRDGSLHHRYTCFGAAIYCIYQDAKGIFWLGSKPRGLFRLQENQGGDFVVEHIAQDVYGHKMADEIYSICQDRWGRLWLSTMDKTLCCILNPDNERRIILNQFREFTNLPQICRSVRYTYITAKDIMFVCTTRGLLVSKLTKTSPYRLRFKIHQCESGRFSSLNNSATMYITETPCHHMFVCTEGGGINRILTKNLLANRFECLHYDESYVSSAIDAHGVLWLIGTKGLTALDIHKNTFVTYNNDVWDDRLLFSDAPPLSLGNGRYIVGLMDGAAIFNTNLLRQKGHIPKMVLTSTLIENKVLNYAVSKSDTIVLDQYQRNIKLTFVALNYKNCENLEYRFRLGEKQQWNSLRRERSVTLLNLSPGTYRLYIESKLLNGEWAGNIRTFTLIVIPTIWQTAVAKVMYILLALILIFSAFYIYFYIREMQRKQNETLKAYLRLLEERNVVSNGNESTSFQGIHLLNDSLSKEEEALMNRIMDYIDQNLAESDINVTDLATVVGVSRSGLNRKMKSIIGITPKEFINRARMHKACNLLVSTHSAVKEIAYACGFADQNYFGKSFRATYGMSPSEYPQKYKK
ncbi:AraC family transcriptional regulator [Bacteroides heparinolyticus]|uniref:AraC family transcriptional regulator n=1 Tax=Prevotella heparinolytica TaxID=28113 RepID=UPI003F9F2273